MRSEVRWVPSVSNLASDQFRDQFLNRCQPVIVRGSAQRWAAMSRWTPEYLRSAVGDLEVPVRRTPLHLDEVDVQTVHQGHAPLRDVIQKCEQPGVQEEYVPGFPLKSAPALRDDIGHPGFLDDIAVRAVSIFLGRNTRCLGHMHPFAQAALTQVVGEKDVVLYAPSDLTKLYMGSVFGSGFYQSRVNFHTGENDRFPRLQQAMRWQARLLPGDSLFIPVHWLHVPTGRDWSVSVTHWWRAHPSQWGNISAAARSVFGSIFSTLLGALGR